VAEVVNTKPGAQLPAHVPGGNAQPGGSARSGGSAQSGTAIGKRSAVGPMGAAGGQGPGLTSGLANHVMSVMHVVSPGRPIIAQLTNVVVPMQYLSALQRDKILELNLIRLKKFIPRLLPWVPASEIVTAFNLSQAAIKIAPVRLKKTFVQTTEFEIQRKTWLFDEPRIFVKNV